MSIVKNTPEVLVAKERELAYKRSVMERAEKFSKLKSSWGPIREHAKLILDGIDASLDRFTEIPTDRFAVHVTALLEQRRQWRFFLELPELSESEITGLSARIAEISEEIRKYKTGLDKGK